jgi:hypothetical protein
MGGVDAQAWFALWLRRLHQYAGSPSYRDLAKHAGGQRGATALGELMTGADKRVRAPDWDLVAVFVTACASWAATHHRPLPPEWADLTIWAQRHRALEELLDHPVPVGSGNRDAVVRVGSVPMLADQFQDRQISLSVELAVAHGRTALLTQLLSGLGGVGKTQVAAEYATRMWGDHRFTLAMWVVATSREAIQAAYADAAVQLVGADPHDPARAADKLLAWLATTGQRWLIVLDDLQRPEDLRQLWPPTTATGQVVVTTRRRDPSLGRGDRRLIDVGVFTEPEALAYLQAKLERHRHLFGGAAELAAELGYLPLAMAQAVAYLINRGLTCHQYCDRLTDQRRTLHQVLPEPGELPDDHATTVAAAFALSMNLADTLNPVGVTRPVMVLASLLDPAGIPASVFATDAVLCHLHGLLGHPVTAADVQDAVLMLHRLNLLTAERTTPQRAVRVHALVQRAIREQATQTSSQTIGDIAYAAADALVEIWPDLEHDLELTQALRDNADVLLAAAEDALWDPGCHAVLFRACRSLGDAGLVTGAITGLRRLHSIADRRLFPDHVDTLTIRSNLASWQGEAGDFAGAAAAFGLLLPDQLRVLGPDHANTLTTRNNLAVWRGRAGDSLGAASATADLLVDQLRVLGPDHLGTLTTRNNLAHWRGHAVGPSEAVTALESLLVDLVRMRGSDDPETLAIRSNLEAWRGMAGDVAGAVVATEELLADRVRILGRDHPDTLIVRHNLAVWRGRSGNAAEAVVAFEDLLADRLRILGPDHPDTLNTRYEIAWWTGQAGYASAAVDQFASLLPDRVRVSGFDHPHAQAVRDELERWTRTASEQNGQ